MDNAKNESRVETKSFQRKNLTFLEEFTEHVKDLPSSEIERDISEISLEIDFLAEQVKHDPYAYRPKRLEEIDSKFFVIRRKREILREEYERR